VIRAVVFAGLLVPGLAAADDLRTVIPITQTVLPDNDIRYSIPVSIGGGPPIPALLDTGSTGLHVFAAALQTANFDDTGAATNYAYGSGERLSGSIATATIGIGAEATNNTIPFQIVRAAGCLAAAPGCPAANLAFADYGIGGDGIANQGFNAIIGVSLTPASDTVNPLEDIGARRWIIALPEPGQTSPGALILNPDEDDLANFQMFPLTAAPTPPGQPSGWQDTLSTCLSDQAAGQTICGTAALDTGSPGIIAYRQDGLSAPLWSPGDSTSLAFSAPGTPSQATVNFAADGYFGSGMVEAPAFGSAPDLVAGVLPFLAYDVLYDANAGAIGLRARPDAPNFFATPAGENASTQIEVIQINTPHASNADGLAISPPSQMRLPQVITP